MCLTLPQGHKHGSQKSRGRPQNPGEPRRAPLEGTPPPRGASENASERQISSESPAEGRAPQMLTLRKKCDHLLTSLALLRLRSTCAPAALADVAESHTTSAGWPPQLASCSVVFRSWISSDCDSAGRLTCFHASFFPFCPLCWPPLFLPFSGHLFALFFPSKMLCSVERERHSTKLAEGQCQGGPLHKVREGNSFPKSV